ncbi:MAG: aminotransferase class I/II-fold pyridoxal phosphate-dependent enzyme [Simkaniaceae bacterium]|nr:aminotransferase class I/II-fold pyridoxal phosphate-dependent enzyme [Simkaniaceae bacterium]
MSFETALEKRREQKEFRQLRCVAAMEEKSDHTHHNFTSNDVLGLSQHPYVKKNTIKYVLEWGAGTTPSRLVTGHLECHRDVEEKLSDLVGKETALLFPSAYNAHQLVLSTLIQPRAMIFIDRYCHNSLIQSAIQTKAQVFRYEHGNLKQLRELLEKTDPSHQKWVITESLFGINGEAIDLKKLAEIAQEFGALTYVDDSNSVGVMGKHGMGLASCRKEIDVTFGSFGAQSGTFGAFIATNKLLKEYLLSFNSELIETTMLPPAGLGAISGSLDLIPDMHVEREKILSLSNTLRELLIDAHWDTGSGNNHIIPALCSSSEMCQKLSNALFNKNILATTLLPPAFPQGTTRLRFIVSALHTTEDLELVAQTLTEFKEEPALSIV